ncbi:MAG: roadblock/LC7 domain-containing protein [Candidatus Hodarchaeales archaeon]|jgi:predicted regulator of Ras-like GTPase activity (Roadblock/LC7/MglB family)
MFSGSFNKEIHEILKGVLRADRSVSVVILGDRTGLTIARVAKLLAAETIGGDLESMAAIASAVYCGAAEQGYSLTLGELDIMIAEFDAGTILTSSCGAGILIVVTEAKKQLGVIRVEMKKSSSNLSKIMTDISTTTKPPAAVKKTEGQSIMSALKELENF